MKFQLPLDLKNLDAGSSEFVSAVARCIKLLIFIINGQIDLVDNCTTSFVSVNFSTANQTLAVMHTLNRVPKGYFVVGSNVGVYVFAGNGTNTTRAIYLQASAVSNVNLLIF